MSWVFQGDVQRQNTTKCGCTNPVRSFDLDNGSASDQSSDVVTFVNVGRFAFQRGQDGNLPPPPARVLEARQGSSKRLIS